MVFRTDRRRINSTIQRLHDSTITQFNDYTITRFNKNNMKYITSSLIGMTLTVSAFAQSIVVTDIVGREVRLDGPAKRVILGEGRQLPTLSLLHPDPVSIIAGWTGDFIRSGGKLYTDYLDAFPAMA